ncbi:MAG TPA: Xaa-Pro peptidase family protein [Vicinamibacterales bacterium]|nr:Xaa-Pro peptidase family protein [Vicinamibacterales bacterium]
MRHASLMKVLALLTMIVALWSALPSAERMGYPPEEFTARRQKLAKALGTGTVLMFGATGPTPGTRFRQDNDFFYLTGNEALNAALVMDVPSGASYLFLPKLTAREIRYEGGNWLEEADAAKKYGFASVQPLSELQEFLARRRPIAGSQVLWTRLSERDYVNEARVDVAIATARRLINPFAQHPTEDAARVTALRGNFPYYEMKDLVPQLDRLRMIKSPREIEILRYNGRISAEALKRAMQATAAGKYEYELEAEAKYWLVKHGFQGDAYPAIVGSGPMGNQWHYEDNGRQMKAGELVVMDYAGSLDYLTTDITRTWPVSGRFTDAQLKAYECVLEAQKALIAAIKPGVTRDAVQSIVEGVFKKHGFDPRYAYTGHYVGMSVHDGGDWSVPFEAGMVLAIEPIIDLPGLHIRIEDSVLVTPTGTEILSAGVPKESEEVMALLRQAARTN